MTAETQRALALAIFNSGKPLTRAAGQFLGQLVAQPGPLSDKQDQWFAQLIERAGVEGLCHGE